MDTAMRPPDYLLLILIMILFTIIIYITINPPVNNNKEGLQPWDTFNARFLQERDGPLGATQSGDSSRQKILNSTQEGLTGGYNPPMHDEGEMEGLPPRGDGGITRTEDSLESSLHSK
jgi:hypothetical protein